MPEQGDSHPYSLPRLTELCAILSDMLPSLPGIIYRCRNNERWTMLDLEEPVRDLTGYGPEELIDGAEIGYAELIHPDDVDRVRKEVAEALDAGLAFRTSYRIVARNGEEKRVWEQGRLARSGPGDGPGEIIGFIQEVTGWREKWERLEQNARLLEQTVASLEEAVLVIDTSGAGRGVLNVNPAAERIFGYAKEELVGGTTEKLHINHDSFLEFARELEPILIRDGIVHASYPMRRKDGTQFAAEQTVTLLDPERGIEGGAVSVVRDVSERQTLADQLQRAQRLEAVGRLAGGVAHDFNNLLTVVRAHADFATMELADADLDTLAAELDAIKNAADKAADLTRQLLAFSREQVLQPRVVDLNDLVRQVERLLGRVIEERVRIRTDLHPEALPLRVDPGQLEQAMVNLAVNARDAMPEGGTLTLATSLETGPLDTGALEAADSPDIDPELVDGPRVALAVIDTGSGMDDTTMARVFEPFFTTKSPGEGTGLGLATAYGFVAQSGGIMDVESAVGEGTTFTIRFPLAGERPEATDEEPPAASGSIEGATILVVEDDPNVLRVIRTALDRAGCRIRAATTGEDAIDLLEEGAAEIDLVITDLVLPGISGRHVVDSVLDSGGTIPILVMSGYSADSPGHGDDLPPEVDFIPKPFTPSALVARVRQLLAG